jgi:hypothetical protein
MSNSYDAEAAPAAPEAEAAPAKVSQEQANYRMGGPLVNCGLCANFGGSWGPAAHTCRVVEGKISGYGLSRQYERQDNPFLAGTQSTFDAGSEEEQPPDQVRGEEPEQPAAPGEPRLQIGNRSY